MRECNLEQNNGSGFLLHATAVRLDGRAVLITGPSGSGKSDLALRLLELGAELISDDQVQIERREGHAVASPPEPIAGKIEVRGVGIVDMPFARHVPVALFVRLVETEDVERLPVSHTCDLLGQKVPEISISAFESSAPLKVRIALRSVTN